jgi:ferritin-like metal-binding protein YciE
LAPTFSFDQSSAGKKFFRFEILYDGTVKITSKEAISAMHHDSLREFYVEELKDLYDAESQILEALPEMIEAASSPELQHAFKDHLEKSKRHVERLERVLAEAGSAKGRKKCKGMEGLIEEGEEHLKEQTEPAVKDASLIAAAQRVEHYEMAGYGCVRTYAQHLNLSSAVELLEQTLGEEKEADKKLTEIAEREVNIKAAEGKK